MLIGSRYQPIRSTHWADQKTHLSWFFNFCIFSFIEFSRLTWLANSFSRASRNFSAEFFSIPMMDSLDSIAALICRSYFSISALCWFQNFSQKIFAKKKSRKNFETYRSAFSARSWRFSRFFCDEFSSYNFGQSECLANKKVALKTRLSINCIFVLDTRPIIW